MFKKSLSLHVKRSFSSEMYRLEKFKDNLKWISSFIGLVAVFFGGIWTIADILIQKRIFNILNLIN
jgi:hypothetical protein